MDSTITQLLKNYHRLRGKGKPSETEILMDLIRIIFKLEECLTYQQLFSDLSEKLTMKESIEAYTYEVLSDGRIVFPSQGNVHLSKSDSDMYTSLQDFEEKFMHDIAKGDCMGQKECMICYIKTEWQEIISHSISLEGGEYTPGLPAPDSLSSNPSHVPESSKNQKEVDPTSLRNVVMNYIRLRGKGKPGIDRLLELFRIIDVLQDFSGYRERVDNPEMTAMIESLKNYTYEVSHESRQCVVVFPIKRDKLTENDLYTSLQSFEAKFMQFLKNHQCEAEKPCNKCSIKELWKGISAPIQETEDQTDYEIYREGSIQKYADYSEFLKKIPEKDRESFILVYRDVNQNKKTYKKFANQEEACKWACDNISQIKDQFVLTDHKGEDKSKRSDRIEVHTIELLHPTTEELIRKNNGLFDSGSDVGVFPYNPEQTKSLIHSSIEINDKVEPFVFAKLKVNGELLEGIHRVNMTGGEWCGFGTPQLAAMSKSGAKNVVDNMFKITHP